MKAKIMLAQVIEGVSTKKNPNGTPYKISKVQYLTEFQPFQNNNGISFSKGSGFGFEPKELELDPEALSQFEKVKFLQEVELNIAPKPTDPSRNWVVGIK